MARRFFASIEDWKQRPAPVEKPRQVDWCIACGVREKQHRDGHCRTCHQALCGYNQPSNGELEAARLAREAAERALLDGLRPVIVPKAPRTVYAEHQYFEVAWDASVRPVERAS